MNLGKKIKIYYFYFINIDVNIYGRKDCAKKKTKIPSFFFLRFNSSQNRNR